MKSQLEKELALVRGLVEEFLEDDPFPETVRPPALREAVRLYPLRGGKRLRPVLTLWSCGAVGGDPVRALNAAAAVEIYHNWTLVHDDIIDCDELRRGKPTCHVELRKVGTEQFQLNADRARKYGEDFAILAGDLQQSWAMDVLLRSTDRGVSPETALAMARRMESFLGRELISGEALDVEFEYRSARPSRPELAEMIRGKTSALLAFSAECGAMTGVNSPDWNRREVTALSAFAAELGYAFQLQDDLLGVFGEEKTFGKPLFSDFREGKPTILFLKAMESLAGEERIELESMMRKESYTEQECSRIRTLLEECGARDAVTREAEEASDRALTSLKSLPENRYRDLLEALAGELLKRTV